MGIGMQQTGVSHVAVEESRYHFGPGVLEPLIGELRCRPTHSGQERHRQHPIPRQLVHDVGDADERVVAVEVAERRDVRRLVPVVDLLADPGRRLARDRAKVR